jgi:tetratricopeptide (TPR) repeat protein
MKKQITIALALLVGSFSFAQKNELKAAEKAIKSGNYADAKAAINSAEPLISSADDKTKAQFYFLKGQALYAKGSASSTDVDKAIESFTKVEEIEGKNGKYSTQVGELKLDMLNDFLTKANAALTSKNYALSSAGFEKAYRMSTKDTLYLYYAAATAVQGQDFDKALIHYEELRDLKFKGIEKQYSATLKSTGESEDFPSKSLRDLSIKAGTHIAPKESITESKSAEIIKNIALIYVNKGENEKAIAAMKEARVQNPDDTSLIISEANVQLKMGNRDEFKSLIQLALEKDPKNPELLFNLGIVAAEAGDSETAKSYYNKALELKPDYADVYNNMAVLILSQEQAIIEEMNSLGSSAADNKKYDQLRDKRTQLYNEAIPYLETTLKLRPKDINAAKTLMNIYSAVDETTKYKAMKAKVEELESGN